MQPLLFIIIQILIQLYQVKFWSNISSQIHFFSENRIVDFFFPSNFSVFIKFPIFFPFGSIWVFRVFMHQPSVMVWQDGPWKLAGSLQTLQSLCSPTELLSAPIPRFSLPTRRQRACEGRERGLQWKQHLFSDSCLLKRQLAKRKKERKKVKRVSEKFQTFTWKRV